MSADNRQRHQSGVTLIELIVVLAVIAIVAGAGAPAFYRMIADNRLATATNDLVADINFTRSEAIKRNQNVAICARANATTCSNDPADWSNGWLVFVDANNNGTIDNGEAILRRHDAIGNALRLSYNNGTALAYDPRGALANGAVGSFTLTENRDERIASDRQIIVSFTGRVRSEVIPPDNYSGA